MSLNIHKPNGVGDFMIRQLNVPQLPRKHTIAFSVTQFNVMPA